MTNKVNLGKAFEVYRNRAPAPGLGRDGPLPPPTFWRLPPIRNSRSNGDSLIDGQRIEVGLKDLNETVDISEAGFSRAYGIFGLPGTGKTVLIKHVLKQLLEMHRDDIHSDGRRPAGLILDPKGVLRTELAPFFKAAQRDVVLINRSVLEAKGAFFNPIPDELTDFELAGYLTKMAIALGATTTEPFWQIQMQGVIEAVLIGIRCKDGRRPTLAEFSDICLAPANERTAPSAGRSGVGEIDSAVSKSLRKSVEQTRAPTKLHELRDALVELRRRLPSDKRDTAGDLDIAISGLSTHLNSNEKRYVVDGLLAKAFGSFRSSAYRCFSPPSPASRHAMSPYGEIIEKGKILSPYEEIIEKGKILLVSADSGGDAGGQMVCMLTKLFFQDVFKRRFKLIEQGRIRNKERLGFLIADEYTDVAAALANEPDFGDAHFFQFMREFNCFALVATQSLEGLSSGRLKDVYKMLLGTMTAKIFFRLGDQSTIEWLSSLAGKEDVVFTTSTSSPNGQSESDQLREREVIPGTLVRSLVRFRAVAVGSLDGDTSGRNIHFFQVPLPQQTPGKT